MFRLIEPSSRQIQNTGTFSESTHHWIILTLKITFYSISRCI